MVLCDHSIKVPGDPRAGTYCKRPAGHWGKHSTLYPSAHNPSRSWKPKGQQKLSTGRERTTG